MSLSQTVYWQIQHGKQSTKAALNLLIHKTQDSKTYPQRVLNLSLDVVSTPWTYVRAEADFYSGSIFLWWFLVLFYISIVCAFVLYLLCCLHTVHGYFIWCCLELQPKKRSPVSIPLPWSGCTSASFLVFLLFIPPSCLLLVLVVLSASLSVLRTAYYIQYYVVQTAYCFS